MGWSFEAGVDSRVESSVVWAVESAGALVVEIWSGTCNGEWGASSWCPGADSDYGNAPSVVWNFGHCTDKSGVADGHNPDVAVDVSDGHWGLE